MFPADADFHENVVFADTKKNPCHSLSALYKNPTEELRIPCKDWGSHSTVDEELRLLGCDTVLLIHWFITFQMIVSPSSPSILSPPIQSVLHGLLILENEGDMILWNIRNHWPCNSVTYQTTWILTQSYVWTRIEYSLETHLLLLQITCIFELAHFTIHTSCCHLIL